MKKGNPLIVQFYGPLREIAEKETEITLVESVPLMEIIRALGERYPGLAPHLAKKMESGPFPSVMFIRQGRPLKRDDMVAVDDILGVFLPVSGG